MIPLGTLCSTAFLSLRRVFRFSLLPSLALLALGQVCAVAFGQTATFGGAQAAVAISGLNSPLGVAVDSGGSLYIADSANNRVVRETPGQSGFTQTVVASGLLAPTGVAVDASGSVYIADTQNNQVLKETLSGGAYTASVVASSLNGPTGIAVDASGNVYIADTQNNRVLKEAPASGAYIQTLVGTNWNGPTGIAVDASGNVYASDQNARVVKQTLSAGTYFATTVYYVFSKYNGLAVDTSGNLYIADTLDHYVVKVTSTGSQSILPSSGFGSLWGLAADPVGDVYVADTGNNRIAELMPAPNFGSVNVGSSSPVISVFFSTPNGGSFSPSVLTKGIAKLDYADAGTGTCNVPHPTQAYNPYTFCSVDVIFAPRLSGTRAGAVVLANSTGTRLAAGYLAGLGVASQASFLPYSQTTIPFTFSGGEGQASMAVDPAGDVFLLLSSYSDYPGNSVVELSPNGSGYTQTAIAPGLNYPVQIALDGAGDIFVADQDDAAIYKETPNGSGGYTQSSVISGVGNVEGVAVDSWGNLYVDSLAYGLLKYTYNGSTYTRSTITTLKGIWQLAVDGSGNLFAMARGGGFDSSIYSPNANGTYTASAFFDGQGIALDNAGNVYTAQPNGTAILKYALSGGSYTQSTIATFPNGAGPFAVDDRGNLYAGTGAGIITKFDFADSPSLIFAATSVGKTSSDSPQSVTLTNVGNAPLVFEVPSSGQNPSITTNFGLNSSSGSACPLLNSSSFTTATLAAGASCQLPISYSPTAATPAYGTLSLMDNALNAAAPAYATQQISLGVSGSQAMPVIHWSQPSPIVYGTQLSSAQLNASSSVPGTFTYTPAAGTTPTVGTQTLSVTLSPSNTTQYGSATATTSIVVTQATPVITWASPSSITYGTALSGTQLNATAPVPGTFTYTPALGTILGAGTQTLSVTFTPTDSTDYASASTTVSLTVAKATPTITWPTPSAIMYGTGLGTTQLNATSTVAGTFAYSYPVGTVLNGGSNYLSVSFTPTDTADYVSTTAYVYLTVNKATPSITWATPSAITFGTSLSATQLNATANVPGYFAYSPAAYAILPAGSNTLTVTFYPNSSQNYVSPVTQTVTLTVNQATPAITWATPAAITYGTALSAAQLNASTSVAGTLVYTPAVGAILTTGTPTLSVTFTPTDSKDYTSTTQTVSLLVNRATPAISWPAPAAIAYGSPITTAQLNATAAVPGTFAYTPAAGTIPPAGAQPLSVTFTPTDTTNYVTATSSASLTINKVPLAITANSFARVYGAANPAFTGGVTGAVNGDSFTETFSASASAASIVGSYPIVPSVTGVNATDYNITPTNGTLTVSQAGSNTSLALTNQNLTMTATVTSLTSGVPSGTVGFYEGQALVGSGTISNGVATYTATSFPSGNVLVSAQYSGDANFTQSSSPPILFLSVSPASSSLSVTRGSSVTDNLSVAVVPGYAGSVQFSCTGLPAETTCAFQPASVTFSSATNTTNVMVTISTNTTASLAGHEFPFEPRNRVVLAAALWLPGMLFAAGLKRRRTLAERLNRMALMLVFGFVASMLAGCGSAAAPQTPIGAYSVQVLANGTGGLSQSASLQLTVQ